MVARFRFDHLVDGKTPVLALFEQQVPERAWREGGHSGRLRRAITLSQPRFLAPGDSLGIARRRDMPAKMRQRWWKCRLSRVSGWDLRRRGAVLCLVTRGRRRRWRCNEAHFGTSPHPPCCPSFARPLRSGAGGYLAAGLAMDGVWLHGLLQDLHVASHSENVLLSFGDRPLCPPPLR